MKKKILSVLFTVLVVLVMFPLSALAAPGDGKSVSLISVDYNTGGIVLIFETSGLTKSDLKGAILFADSNYQGLYCVFKDKSTTVRCTAAKKLAGTGNFRATLAGFVFWGELPKARVCNGGKTLWYSIAEYHHSELNNHFEVPAWAWDENIASGILEIVALEGWIYEITGSFCSSASWVPAA